MYFLPKEVAERANTNHTDLLLTQEQFVELRMAWDSIKNKWSRKEYIKRFVIGMLKIGSSHRAIMDISALNIWKNLYYVLEIPVLLEEVEKVMSDNKDDFKILVDKYHNQYLEGIIFNKEDYLL